MWVLFGFITFASFFTYNLHRRINGKWLGKKDITSDKKIEYEFGLFRKNTLLFIGVDAPRNINFLAKPEKKIDHFFKKLKVSVEMQLGNSAIDKKVYFATDNDALFDVIRRSQELQNSFSKIIDLFSSKDFNFRKISCCGGRIWIEVFINEVTDDYIGKLAEKVAPLLLKISKELRGKADIITKKEGRFAIKAAAILSTSSAAGIFSLCWIVVNRISNFPKLIELDHFIIHSLVIGIVAIILMVFLTLKLLGKTSRAHLVLIELVLIGAISFSAAGGILLRNVNIEYDKSSSTSVNAKLLKKYSKYRRNTGTHYYLKILSSQKSYEIETDSHFFSAVKESGDICLRERSGFLGYRWISDISINKCL